MNSFNVEVKLYFAIKTQVQVKVTMRETIMRYLAAQGERLVDLFSFHAF